MARKTLAELLTQITTLLADNVSGDISEADVRSVFTDIKDSFAHLDAFEAHTNDNNNPHAVDASDVGLGNCDNTSDANKPISNATQSALDNKQAIASAALTGTVLRFDKTAVYGTYASPENGNITALLSGAKVGTVITLIHNKASEPTYGSEFHPYASSMPYAAGLNNYYTFVLVDAGRILYKIEQE